MSSSVRRLAERVVVVLVLLQAPEEQREQPERDQERRSRRCGRRSAPSRRSRQHAGQRDRARHEQRQHREVGAAQVAVEAEAQAAPAGVGHPELHRRAEQRRPQRGDDQERDQPRHRRDLARHRVQQHHRADQQEAAQHALRVAVEVQRMPADRGVAVEVAQAPHLGPRVVQAERHQREQQVDDPDAEILAARAAEDDLQRVVLAGQRHRLGGGGRLREPHRLERHRNRVFHGLVLPGCRSRGGSCPANLASGRRPGPTPLRARNGSCLIVHAARVAPQPTRRSVHAAFPSSRPGPGRGHPDHAFGHRRVRAGQDQGRRDLHRAGRAAMGQPHRQGAEGRGRARRDRVRVQRERHQRRLRARDARLCRERQHADRRRGVRGRGRGAQGREGLPEGQLPARLAAASRRRRTSACSTTTSRSRPTCAA